MNDTDNQISQEEARHTRIGVWAARIFSVVTLLFLGFTISVVIEQGHFFWTDTLFISVSAIISLGNLYSIFLIKKPNSHALGTGILFSLNLATPTLAGIILEDFGVMAISFIAVFSFVMVQWVLPKKSRRWSIISIVVAVIAVAVSDLLNPTFQAGASGFENIAPIITVAMGIAFTLLIMQRAWHARIRTKILVGFAIVSIIGSVFAFFGSQFAIDGITSNALPNIEALGNVGQAVRSVQAETLEFVVLGDANSVSEFYAKVDDLNASIIEIEGLASSLDQSGVLPNLNTAISEMVFVSERILQSHTKTLGFLDNATVHQETANFVRKNAETILNHEAAIDIENDRLGSLSEDVIPAKDALAEFMSLVNVLNRESQSFVASGDNENLTRFADATIDLAAARSKLVSSLTRIGEQEALIKELQEIEFQALSIGQDIILSNSGTLDSLDELEKNEAEIQASLLEVKELADEGVEFGLQIVTSYTTITSLVALIASLLVGVFITRTITTPLSRLLDATKQLETGDFSARANLRPGDEFGTLATAFNSMAGQLGETLTSLEEQVTNRTAALEQRSSYLESAADASQTIAAIIKPEEIISKAVNIIQTRFEFYYVGLFITDNAQRWAVLQAGTGIAGKTMLERGHRIRIGDGMIGWSIANAKARIALDVGEDAVRFDNPDLPETRSEVALPLRSRGRVLGALTVQSAEEAAFDHDIMATLQTMADQVATSLDNAELFATSEAALEAERKAYGEMSRDGWIALAQKQASPRFVADVSSQTARPLDVEQSPEIIEAIRNGNLLQDDGKTMLIPLKSREIVLGGIKLRKREGDGVWSKAQISMATTLSGQLGVALESARLFDQTQKRAAQEHVVGEAAARMRETLDIESVLQTTARELRDALGISAAEVWIGTEDTSENNSN